MRLFCKKYHSEGLLKKVVFFLLWLFLSSFGQDNKILFNSEKLKQIYGSLKDECRKNIQERSSSGQGTYFIDSDINGSKYKLIFRINNFNELDHLGLYLIKDSLNLQPIREVFDYLEREFLVSALLGDQYPLTTESKNEKIELVYNGRTLKNEQKLFNVSRISIDQNTPFRVRYDPDFFMIEWDLKFSNKFGVKIPNNYSLITEKTKDELELDLLRKIKFQKTSNIITARPRKDQLKPYGTDIFLLTGEIFATTPELSSNRFFMVNDSIYPVFNRLYFQESICDLFLNMISTHKILDITQKLYGGNKEKFKINLNSFYSTFAGDYLIYFGWQNVERENMKASIIICNTIFNFNHLLVIYPSSKTIFDKTGEIKALFYAYIPKENLKKISINSTY